MRDVHLSSHLNAIDVKQSTRSGAAAKSGAAQVVPRAQLATAIQRLIQEKELTQTAAGAVVQEAPSQISLLMSGRLAGFSTDRLIRMLLRLGRDVEINVIRRGGSGRTGHVKIREIGPARGPGRPPKKGGAAARGGAGRKRVGRPRKKTAGRRRR